ncbi:MAG TPA: HepT-like ribonuclease domain-containing protein [Longimicrobium sp.]|nr:HepT-like ribonuclease domain-containing protein [Longimicrobium sp.]
MRPDERDAAFLWEMRRAAADCLEMARDLTLERLEQDMIAQYAMSKVVELIGETANKVSTGYRSAHPEIPWSAIIGLRHRLVHDYWRTPWTADLECHPARRAEDRPAARPAASPATRRRRLA